MSKETKAIKAVALVAEQAYREVFHVDDTATTTELNVLADAVAALDKPTPAPEPPKAGTHGMCSCGHAGAFHHPGDGHCWICRCRQYDGTSSMPPQPHFPGQPEASQPKPLKAETCVCGHRWGDHAFYDGPCIHQCGCKRYSPIRPEASLAALWPKVGQVPSVTVTQLVAWAEQEYPDLYNRGREIPGDFFTRLADHLSRMGQPAPLPLQSELDKCAADELRRIEAKAKGDQPAPVTAEKLVEQIRTIPNPWSGDVDLFQNIRLATRQGFEECREAVLQLVRSQGLAQPVTAEKLDAFMLEQGWWETTPGLRRRGVEAILKTFPTLGSGRLTRDDPRVQAIINKWRASDYNSYNIIQMVGDLLALQGPMTVSKEQWEKLFPKGYLSSHRVGEGTFKDWLKDTLGIEVEE